MDQILPSRGIRQGDLLPPYIFIICIELLGHLIEAQCSSKSWNPVKSARGGLVFSHLFFANDLVLFARANHVNCTIVRKVLNEFCERSGKIVSEAKSKVYFRQIWIGT